MTTKAYILGSALLVFGLPFAGCKEELPEMKAMKRGPVPGKPIKEDKVMVTAKPEIQNKKDYSLLLLPAVKGRPIEVVCGADFSPWFTSLLKDKLLTFTVWQTKQVSWHTDDGEEEFSWACEIETIKDGPNVLYDAAICPLHKVRMKRAEIEISYGLPMGGFFEAGKEFSGGPGFVLGGCVVGPERTRMGYKCDECVAAYERWEKKWGAENEKRIQKQKAETQESKGS